MLVINKCRGKKNYLMVSVSPLLKPITWSSNICMINAAFVQGIESTKYKPRNKVCKYIFLVKVIFYYPDVIVNISSWMETK